MPLDGNDNGNLRQAQTRIVKVIISKNGPYLVSGGLPLGKETIEVGYDGEPIKWSRGESYSTQEDFALCRCGRSKNQPFCDGTHTTFDFDGTETASRENYLELADKFPGPELFLTDARGLCATARFCDRAGGIWSLNQNSDKKSLRAIAIEEAGNCPSGRLVAWDKSGAQSIEPSLKPAISLVEDPASGISGPIWLKGGILLVSADGFQYEIRNRMTLCRCGRSGNKPFCNGTHISAGFKD